VLAFIPALIVIYFTAVKKEEQYLEKKFGQEYVDYKKKVRRWI
jgi:protein-S-isoprenylcysteine O-methyltransferase Ste14